MNMLKAMNLSLGTILTEFHLVFLLPFSKYCHWNCDFFLMQLFVLLLWAVGNFLVLLFIVSNIDHLYFFGTYWDFPCACEVLKMNEEINEIKQEVYRLEIKYKMHRLQYVWELSMWQRQFKHIRKPFIAHWIVLACLYAEEKKAGSLPS